MNILSLMNCIAAISKKAMLGCLFSLSADQSVFVVWVYREVELRNKINSIDNILLNNKYFKLYWKSPTRTNSG